MTVEELNILVYYIINKNNAQGDLSPDEFNLIANTAQYSYQDFLLGEVQQYQNARPLARIDYSANEKIRQKLTPTIKETLLTIDGTGKADYPADYLLTDALLDATNNRIRFVSQDRLYSFLNSTIDPVDTNPIYLIKDTYLQFYPVTLASANLSYVQKAPKIVYNTEDDANGREVYKEDGSVDPIWADTDMLDIVVRMLDIIGVPMQLTQVRQYAAEIKTQGQ